MVYVLSLRLQAKLYAALFMSIQAYVLDVELTNKLRKKIWKDLKPIIDSLPDD